ncbi:MAG: metallophosphoesterase family protein [Candidatus Thorarchaeota archaeon]|jgi:Icc-related predicted phosphoesterase
MISGGERTPKAGEGNVRIAGVADIHSPRYLDEFRRSLSDCGRIDLILLAGDMINFGKYREYHNIVEVIDFQLGSDIPIVSCFGNEEHVSVRDEIVSLVGNRVKFLDDSAFSVDIDGAKIGIVGAPTIARRKDSDADIQKIRETFEKRSDRISQLLVKTSKSSTFTILLMHYNPLIISESETDPDSFSWWVARAVEKAQPDFVLHGHVHGTDQPEVAVGRTRVINVAFPARGKVTEIQL